MMYEYLDIAKTKKKFSMAIRGKGFSCPMVAYLLIAPPVIKKRNYLQGDRCFSCLELHASTTVENR